MESANANMAKIFRVIAWILNCYGHYLLFSPIISLLNWIPLIGSLLGSIFSFATIIFAVIWGTLIHLTVMCVAWILYRPMIGIIMLSVIICMIYLIFFMHKRDEI